MEESDEPARFNPAAEGFSADLPPAEPLSAADLKAREHAIFPRDRGHLDPVGSLLGHHPLTEVSFDLPPLSPATQDARGLIDLVGEYTVMALFSKNWVLREAAVARIDKLLASGQVQSDDDRETFRTLARGIQRLFKDKARRPTLLG